MKNKNGSMMILVLVYGAVFILIFGGLSGLVFTQYQQSEEKVSFTEALNIAEAGINYSRWHFAHAPSDYSFSGTYNFNDPEGGTIGGYTLQITPPANCSNVVIVKSTGWTNDYPGVKRTVSVRFGKPSLAQYSFLTNTDVWFGPDEQLKGPFHSNGGIRMDGTQNALSTSAKATYTCQPVHGCNPAQTKPGIWGAGSGGTQGLWEFPVPAIDFSSLTYNLAQLKTQAQSGGYYFASSTAFGYHLQFQDNGTFNLYKVTKLSDPVNGEDTSGVWHNESNDISSGNTGIQLMIENGTGANHQAYKSSVDNLSTSYTLYTWPMTTNPLTGSAWTTTEINSWTTRFGVQRINGPGGKARVTQIYNTVNYTYATSTGYLSPSANNPDTGGDGDGFEVNPTGAYADGGTFASNMNNTGDRHRFYNYNFNIPAGATINGIIVRPDWWLDSTSGSNSVSIELSWNGGSSWTSAKTESTKTTSDTNSKTVGSSSDTWGRTWSVSDFSNSNFRLRITCNSSSSSRDFYLDWLAVRIYYTLSGTNVTLSPSAIGNFNDWIVNGTSDKVAAVNSNDGDTTYIGEAVSSQTYVLANAGLPSGATINSVTLNVVAEGVVGNAETFIGNYPLASGACGPQNLIYLEDSKVWVDGVVSQKATVAAGVFPDNPTTNSSIIVDNNLTRTDPSVAVPALITQNNVLVPYYSPDTLEIDAVMVAQKGAVQRYYYSGNIKSQITVRGAIATNNVWTWTWVNGSNNVVSGYQTTQSFYEPDLIYNPPPYFPDTGQNQFISWEEVQ